jgi:hypothetical protein
MKKAVLRCGCGCGRPVPEGRSTYASRACADRQRQRRRQKKNRLTKLEAMVSSLADSGGFALEDVEIVDPSGKLAIGALAIDERLEQHVCEICQEELVRTPGDRSRLYHDKCRP